MSTEPKDETAPTLRVVDTRIDGTTLYLEIASSSRDLLVDGGRRFATEYAAEKHPQWASAGVEKSNSPVAFDPQDPQNDPYKADHKKGTIWHYRQTVRLTRSPV